ncbi:hypothetical protein ACHAQH_001461 [Verticillium albo-atrum]
MATRKHRKLSVLSRQQVEGLIADGRAIIIVDDYVLKVDAWLRYHPGGDKAIRHMIGRDATDEVTVGANSREPSPVFDANQSLLHHRQTATRDSASSSSSVSSRDEDYIGPEKMTPTGFLDLQTKKEISLDLDRYPSLDSKTQHDIVQKYRLLNKRIQAEGLYDCNYLSYAIEMIRYSMLFGGMLFFLSRGWYVPSGMCLGIFWHQLVFAAHDAGHMGITHDFHFDTCIGIFIADFIGGLSLGWWKRSHNVHHIVTNSPEHDPDIEHLPFFAVSHRLLGDLYSTYYERMMKYDAFAKVMLSIQSKTYYLIMLFGRFNLYVLSWDHLIAGRAPRHGPAWWHRWLEVVGQVFFWTWFGYGIVYKSIPTAWDRFVFVIVSHMLQAPLHVQITLSHFAMSTADLGPAESFPQRMLRTTMDVDCPAWLDFFHGGLQFQAIHHLYPRIPRHNLRRTQKLVQEFCVDVGIPYALYGFVDGNKTVIGKLAEVSRQAAILAECQKHVASHE